MVFSQTRSSEGTRLCWLCAEWGVTLQLSWLGHKQAVNWTHIAYLRNPCFLPFLWVFRVERRCSVRDGIVSLGNVLRWWWGGRKGSVSVPSGWLVTRAGISWGDGAMRKLILSPLPGPVTDKETKLLSPSLATISTRLLMEISWSVLWLWHCSAWQEPCIWFPPPSLAGFLALSEQFQPLCLHI